MALLISWLRLPEIFRGAFWTLINIYDEGFWKKGNEESYIIDGEIGSEINLWFFEYYINAYKTQPAFICSKSTIEAPEQCVKYVQS